MSGTAVRDRLFSLRFCAPLMLDPLARQYVASSSLAAGMQGFVANLGGVATMPLSISADTLGTLDAEPAPPRSPRGTGWMRSGSRRCATNALFQRAGLDILTLDHPTTSTQPA